eukprot:3825222-Amphidinium_carterae.1
MPLWCAKDTKRWFYGAVLPTLQGSGTSLQRARSRATNSCYSGLTKVILRSDGEHSILALKTQ